MNIKNIKKIKERSCYLHFTMLLCSCSGSKSAIIQKTYLLADADAKIELCENVISFGPRSSLLLNLNHNINNHINITNNINKTEEDTNINTTTNTNHNINRTNNTDRKQRLTSQYNNRNYLSTISVNILDT